MKLVDTQEKYMTNHVVEQLNQLGFYATEDKTQKELINILARMRALEIKAESPHNTWF